MIEKKKTTNGTFLRKFDGGRCQILRWNNWAQLSRQAGQIVQLSRLSLILVEH